MSLGPFDLTGGPFLQLYAILYGIALIAGAIIPHWLRPDGRGGRTTDTHQLAYLAGGPARFADAIVARLLAAEALVMTGKDSFHARLRGAGRSAAEHGVLTLPGEPRWPQIERVLKTHASPVEHRLVAAGLLMDEGLTRQMRFWQTLPCLLLFSFGATKWIVGDMRHRPVGYLTAFLLVTAVTALIRWVAVDRRTRGGQEALRRARAESARLELAPTAPETDLAVALFGTAVLAGSGWSAFHQLRSASDGGGSGGDGGGGSGCGGGGGCGGCGS